MAILTVYLQTLLEPETDFGLWNGVTFYTVTEPIDEFIGEVGQTFQTNLNLVEEFSYNIIGARPISSQLVIFNSFSGYVLNITRTNTLTEPPDPVPGLIPPDDLPPPVVPDAPKPFQDAGKLAATRFAIFYQDVLVWDASGPEFGDTEQYKHNRELLRSRGGSVINLYVSSWGSENIFEYTFNWFNKSQKDALLKVLKNVLGKKVTIVDHFGYNRVGWITSPDTDVAESAPKGNSVTLRFQLNA